MFALTKGRVCRHGDRLGGEYRVRCIRVLPCWVCDRGATGSGGGSISPDGAISGATFEWDFSTHGVVANSLIITVSDFSFELSPAL